MTSSVHIRWPWLVVGTVVVTAITGSWAVRNPSPELKPVVWTDSTLPRHEVTIRHPAGPPVAHGVDPRTGDPVTIACVTCHATRTPNFANQASADLDLFHQGLMVTHGANTCLSCHNPQDYGSLHLANGTRVEFTDVVTLCSQCHGPQWRDYQHGAHGGMTGSWDLTKGPRERNGCTSCHDPHAPKFRGAHPVLQPQDRFLEPTHE